MRLQVRLDNIFLLNNIDNKKNVGLQVKLFVFKAGRSILKLHELRTSGLDDEIAL